VFREWKILEINRETKKPQFLFQRNLNPASLERGTEVEAI
jgi:hypothetical protein